MYSMLAVCGSATIAIVPLIAAAWLPPGFPAFLLQIFMCGWGVGAILIAQRLFFSATLADAVRAVGFAPALTPAIATAIFASLPMWAFLPLAAWTRGVAVDLRPNWCRLLLGVVLVNGITEEVIHRGFVFGRLRTGRTFATAASASAAIFAAQHLYIGITTGWIIGLASVVLALFVSFPMAVAFERSGNSLIGPAILHTSTNAPVIILALPEGLTVGVLVAHMAVIVFSLWLFFLSRRPRQPVRSTF